MLFLFVSFDFDDLLIPLAGWSLFLWGVLNDEGSQFVLVINFAIEGTGCTLSTDLFLVDVEVQFGQFAF